MILKASFANIKSTIIEHIQKAKFEIKIAIAWFTNKEILGELIEKLDSEVKISILISDDKINSKINYNEYIKKGGIIKIIPSGAFKFLHEKFSLFDNEILITGSYNYTYNAEYNNYESIIITDHQNMIKQYNIRFEKIIKNSIKFEQMKMVSNISDGIFKNENELEHIEKELEKELLQTLDECKRLRLKFNYNLIYELIGKYGAIGTPKRLISTGVESVQSGFIKLWEIDRLDLTFEAIILKNKYRKLFDIKTLDIAQKRIEKLKK